MEPERGQLYARVSWDSLERTTRLLAEMVRPRFVGRNYPTTIVAIGRGGLVPARILADELSIRRVESLAIEAQRTTAGEIVLVVDWEGADQIRKLDLNRVLFADDIVDSGTTVAFVHDHFGYPPVATVYTRTPVRTGKRSPDYAGRVLDPKGPMARTWLTFPYESRESTTLLREGVEVQFS